MASACSCSTAVGMSAQTARGAAALLLPPRPTLCPRPFQGSSVKTASWATSLHAASGSAILSDARSRSLVVSATSSQQPIVPPSEAVSTQGAGQQPQDSNEQLIQEGEEYAASEQQQDAEEQQAPLMQEIEVETSEEVEVEPLTVQLVAERARTALLTTNYGKAALVGVGAVLVLTLGVAVRRTFDKANTPRAKRLQTVSGVLKRPAWSPARAGCRRDHAPYGPVHACVRRQRCQVTPPPTHHACLQISRNRALVDGINEMLLNSGSMTSNKLRSLQRTTGVTAVEAFRCVRPSAGSEVWMCTLWVRGPAAMTGSRPIIRHGDAESVWHVCT